jgi:transcriptional regulator with XRE-family HTH domain
VSDLGRAVRQLRKEQGLTQTELADRIGGGMSQAYISAIERGKLERPTLEKLQDIARGLGVSYNRLAAAAGFIQEEDGAAQPKSEVEQIYDDLIAAVADRPQVLRTLRRLRGKDPSAYHRALIIIRNWVAAGMQTLDDLEEEGDRGGDSAED